MGWHLGYVYRVGGGQLEADAIADRIKLDCTSSADVDIRGAVSGELLQYRRAGL